MDISLPLLFDLAGSQLVGVFFVLSGVMKAVDRHGTVKAVSAYGVMPPVISHAAALVLPWIELLAASSLILGIASPFGAGIAAILLLAFSVVQTVNLVRGDRVPRGCFASASDDFISWGKVSWNLFMMAICSIIMVFHRATPSPPLDLTFVVRMTLLDPIL